MSKIEREKYNLHLVEKDPQLYILIKLSDDKFNGFHPNGIDKGYNSIGTFQDPPTVGDSFTIINNITGRYLVTSTVTEIISDTKFKTKNSTYELREFHN